MADKVKQIPLTKRQKASIFEAQDVDILEEKPKIKPPPTDEVISVPIEEKEDNSKKRVLINLKDDDQLNDFVKKDSGNKTEPQTEDQKERIFGKDDTIQTIQDKVKATEDAGLKPEQVEDVAEFIIELFDVLIVTGLRSLAKDDIDSPYEIAKAKKTRLKYMLACIIVKYQAKFPIEYLFLAMLGACYFSSTKIAIEHRKKVNRLQKLKAEDGDKDEIKDLEKELRRDRGRPTK